MLDQLRRHASSWMIKATLAVIILTFIFFFGYSRISSRYQDQRIYIASVGDEGIPRRKYENLYQNSLDNLRQGLQGELPANLESFLRENVLSQLISRELTYNFGQKLGLTVSDTELAEEIRRNNKLFPDGKFDLKLYQERFLPTYEQRNGENFEDAMRRDLLVQKTQALLPILFSSWNEELEKGLKEHPKPKKKSETQPESLATNELTSFELFYPWLDQLRQESKVEIYR